ncbi:hypothetical protein WN944_010501 [Citrus x changshan-huyou]|uniref:HECT-type E3 ubiquitin transferase n=1 Tax=Citrus x changshan-huyou TaxID=2935761 RepID=A0AAP0QSY4_9ROSI
MAWRIIWPAVRPACRPLRPKAWGPAWCGIGEFWNAFEVLKTRSETVLFLIDFVRKRPWILCSIMEASYLYLRYSLWTVKLRTSLHLDYFCFSGRVIALALMHRVQVGVVSDHMFYLKLARKYISPEDIRDQDPSLSSSCKQIWRCTLSSLIQMAWD